MTKLGKRYHKIIVEERRVMCSRSQVLIKKYCIVPINHIFTLSEINELCLQDSII